MGGTAYDYQNCGNHDTKSADLDGDGWDEVVLKAMVLKLDADKTKILPKVLNGDVMPTIEGFGGVPPVAGSFQFATDEVRDNPLNVWAPLRHGDRTALLPVDKTGKVMMWSGSEEHLLDDMRTGRHLGWIPGPEAHDPMKGKRLDADGQVVHENSLLYGVYQGSDDEGSVAGNYSNRWPGAQAGSAASTREVRSLVTGEVLTTTATSRGIAQGQNAIWFGGGLTHMGVNGATVNRIDDLTFAATSYLATGMTSTGNKSTPTLKADLFGDWREELVLRAGGNRLGIVTTLAPTQYGIRTLMHDPMYRLGVANKNNGYDQVGFASFYLGDEAPLPSMRTDIAVPRYEPSETTVSVPRTDVVAAQRVPVTVPAGAPLPVAGATVQLVLDGVAVGDPVALDEEGVARSVVGPLTAGTHEFTAEFAGVRPETAGADGVAESVSEPVTLTVRPVGPAAS
ncbi:Ig-like domain repeat protein [Isoptericola variabilis]|uniref:Rhamnogalacturonan lyase family 11 C-terminal domain-containing protein n=1 Tax=Isoptericola variabilis (strain 225) TaxID=743718 RepID=F6FVC7_ISOV2|nr:Ig-like domain repeat protein [Isoptericola variabilis]AEG43400.1 hypothetical protein Isova_0613 [Isoptericola variabilis 225]TWH34543.1 Ig-like domain-containing protein [Isoptericola variabilis J7]